jgi:LAS superfamily LD-carboxypeptidase LdcB
MSKTLIKFGVEDETYRQLEFVARQQGKNVNQMGSMAVDFFLLFLRHSALRAYFNDKTLFDKKAAETFKALYGITIEEAEAEIADPSNGKS